MLEKADIIIYNPKDVNKFLDIYAKFPNKEYIFEFNTAEQLSNEQVINAINQHAAMLKDRFTIMGSHMLPMLNTSQWCPFNIMFNCDTFKVLNWWQRQGVNKIIVGDPLFFQLPTVKQFYPDTQIYCIPNDLRQGQYGTGQPDDMWIQPEAIDQYKDLIDVIFFKTETLQQEAALFKIYARDKRWDGKLRILMPTSEIDCNSAFIPPEVTTTRLNCKHKCLETKNCHICKTAFLIADYEKLKNSYNIKKEE